jgi:hypothetical protein
VQHARAASVARTAPNAGLPFTDPQPPAEGPPDAGVEEGVGAFVKPPPMEVDHWYVVEFAAGPTEQKIRAETEGQALTAPAQIYVGKWMRVVLLDDPAFEIKRKSPIDGKGEQETGLDKTATWLWDVRPKAGGAHSLQAEVEVLDRKADGSFERIDGYTRKVDVTVKVGALRGTLGAIDQASSIGDKLTGLFNSWQKTVTALVALIAAIGLLMWRIGLRKTKPD